MAVRINRSLVRSTQGVVMGGRFTAGGGGGSFSQGPSNGGTVSVILSPSDIRFTNVNGVLGNSSYAEAFNNTINEYDASDELKVSNFGFTIPTGATIDGIEVSLTAYSSANGGSIDGKNLIFNDNYYGLDDSYTGISSTPTVYTFGGPTFKWPVQGDDWAGQSMTPSVVNNPNFSFIFYVRADVNQTVYVKNVTMKVYYTT